MFGFQITYLRGSVTAADIRSGNEKDKIEWPPHPDRFFCALVQAWGDLGETACARAALGWLEAVSEKSPPLIRCGDALGSTTVQTFVPVNDTCSPVTKDNKPAPLIAGTLLGRVRRLAAFQQPP